MDTAAAPGVPPRWYEKNTEFCEPTNNSRRTPIADVRATTKINFPTKTTQASQEHRAPEIYVDSC